MGRVENDAIVRPATQDDDPAGGYRKDLLAKPALASKQVMQAYHFQVPAGCLNRCIGVKKCLSITRLNRFPNAVPDLFHALASRHSNGGCIGGFGLEDHAQTSCLARQVQIAIPDQIDHGYQGRCET